MNILKNLEFLYTFKEMVSSRNVPVQCSSPKKLIIKVNNQFEADSIRTNVMLVAYQQAYFVRFYTINKIKGTTAAYS